METSAGRKVFQDENGENYSEKTITFETEYGWINMPTVDSEGNQLSQEELEAHVAENGPVDPVTGETLSTYEDVDSAVEAAQERTDALGDELEATRERNSEYMAPDREPRSMNSEYMSKEFNCGGGLMDMDEMIVGYDEVSGNPVPVGSSATNVRDDIPAALSEGEYVVPADVVRYHGLKTFMELREEAKMGLMAMAMEGQIKSLDEEGYEMDEAEEEEEGEYETPEGNEVEVAEVEVEEEYMEPEEEGTEDEDMYPTQAGQYGYKPRVIFATIK
jgi:hypothetical protein